MPAEPISLKVITARANPAVTLSEAKLHLRVDGVAEDALIAALVTAATEMVERRTRRSLINQTFRWTFDYFPAGAIELPRSPASQVAAGGAYAYSLPRVRYYDENGDQQTLIQGDDYFLDLDTNPPSLQLLADGEWPMTQTGRNRCVEVDFVAGYGDNSAVVPELLKVCVKMLAGHWFANREAVGVVGTEVPFAVDSILSMFHDGGF